MDVREALYTTRAMRRVKPDPIPADVQARILDAAIRAPSGGNSQNWRFLLIDDPDVKARLGPLYRDAIATLWETFYRERLEQAEVDAGRPGECLAAAGAVVGAAPRRSLRGRAAIPRSRSRAATTAAGSIFPAVWSAQLAARADGVGSSLTSVLGSFHGDQTMEILGVPPGKGWTMACLVSFGYPTGRWGVAPRRPVHEVAYRNTWGTPIGFEISEPLWHPEQ